MQQLTPQQQAYLKQLGISLFERQSWLLQEATNTSKKLSHEEEQSSHTPPKRVKQESCTPLDNKTVLTPKITSADKEVWQTLMEQVRTCTKCPLHQGRTNSVFGVGNQQADLLVVGEAPGYYEDQQGEPFVGRAGQLLDKMLKAIQLNRNIVYIANVLKCRPPNNRDPLPTEVASCTPYLQQQIDLLKPRLILALGRVSAHYLLDNTLSLARMRGRTFNYGAANTPLIVTYHPAYLLRSPQDKRKAYDDLLKVKTLLAPCEPHVQSTRTTAGEYADLRE